MQLLKRLKQEGYHLTIISKQTGVAYMKLYRAEQHPLKEQDIRKVEQYASKVGINPYAD